jgi:hypothetical protein
MKTRIMKPKLAAAVADTEGEPAEACPCQATTIVGMEALGIWEVLTGDKHLESASFQRLIRP